MAIPASIAEFLDRHHARYSVLTHPAAYTAQEEAAAAHVPGHEWAKVVVCVADDRPVLAVVPAPLKVDVERLRDVTHAHSLRLAREDELQRLYADCEIGAMPPLGPLYHQDVIVDETLAAGGNVVFEAGSHQASIRMPYGEFARVVGPRVAAVATGSRGTRTGAGPSSDIVCGADVTAESAWGWSEHEGQRYYFCSQVCKMEFDDNPVAYTRAPL